MWDLHPATSEALFQSRLEDLARELQTLRWHHETDSRRTRSGWPDLVLCGPGGMVVAELKKNDPRGTRPTEEQARWLAAIAEARGTAVPALWRPADFAHCALVMHRLAGRRPHQTLIDELRATRRPRHRIRLLPAHPAYRPGTVLGDFSTRRDADDVRAQLTQPEHTDVISTAQVPDTISSPTGAPIYRDTDHDPAGCRP